jgi:pyruvate formate lyase activating enzyme
MGEAEAGTLFKIKRFALHDGPGVRTTVFLKGCPLRCFWCHNPEGQRPEPQPIEREVENEDGRRGCVMDTVGWTTDGSRLIAELEKDRIFWDASGGGVTISGGEPLFQPGFLHDLLARCHGQEIHTALDTSGYAPWETLARMKDYVDLFLFDLKSADDTIHKKVTGVSNRLIIDNLSRLAASGARLRVRIPIVPGVNDDTDQVDKMLRVLAPLDGIRSVDLLSYHRIAAAKYQRLKLENPMGQERSLEPAALDPIRSRFERHGYRVQTGG